MRLMCHFPFLDAHNLYSLSLVLTFTFAFHRLRDNSLMYNGVREIIFNMKCVVVLVLYVDPT